MTATFTPQAGPTATARAGANQKNPNLHTAPNHVILNKLTQTTVSYGCQVLEAVVQACHDLPECGVRVADDAPGQLLRLIQAHLPPGL